MNRIEFVSPTLAATIVAVFLVAFPTRASKNDERVPPVSTVRVPNSGIQPQIAIDGKGVLHLVYFSGDAAHGDLYYVRSADRGATFSAPLKVNSHPGSAIATGNIRGAHVAIGRNGRVYVAWNGTYEVDRPETRKPWMKHPMLFARINDAGTRFESERNLINAAYGLDGGGAIAADSEGDVYVFWHAPAPGTERARGIGGYGWRVRPTTARLLPLRNPPLTSPPAPAVAAAWAPLPAATTTFMFSFARLPRLFIGTSIYSPPAIAARLFMAPTFLNGISALAP